MDVCNQRLIQQEVEIRNLKTKLRKYGLLEEAMEGSIEIQSNRYPVEEAEGTLPQIGRPRPHQITTIKEEKISGGKSSLNLRVSLQNLQKQQPLKDNTQQAELQTIALDNIQNIQTE